MTIPDKQDILDLWELLGCPELPLAGYPGVTIKRMDLFLNHCEEYDHPERVMDVRLALARFQGDDNFRAVLMGDESYAD